MEELAKLEEERGTAGYADESGRRVASNEMCTFLILNISSLQLIPVNMIAYIYLFTICCCMALKLHGTILQ